MQDMPTIALNSQAMACAVLGAEGGNSATAEGEIIPPGIPPTVAAAEGGGGIAAESVTGDMTGGIIPPTRRNHFA